jgi:hypothetical protein
MLYKNLHYLLLFAFLATSPSLFPYTVLGATNQELEASLKACHDSRNTLKQRIEKECPNIDQMERECKALYEKVKRTRSNPPEGYRIAHKQWRDKATECDQIFQSFRSRQLLGETLTDQLILLEKLEKCSQDQSRLFDKFLAEDRDFNRLVSAQQDDYNQCKQKLTACKSLNGQFISAANACDDIARQLETARGAKPPDDDPIQGTLNTFIVECVPSQVQPGMTVSCTAHGRYSSKASLLNLTNDPYTKWQSSLPGQSGPTVSARGLKPGQTFTVRASRGQISESATVTVVEKLEGDQRGGVGEDTMNFSNPMHKDMRLDVCMNYGSECGKSVADAFCRSKGYSYAKSFEQQVVGPSINTKIMGDESICERKDYCTGFSYILCAGKKK